MNWVKLSENRIDAGRFFCSPDSSSLSPNWAEQAAAVMDRAPSLTAAAFTSTDHHVRQFLLHQAWLPIQNKNSGMCQLKLPFPLLLSSQRCVLPQRGTWFIHLFTLQGNTWSYCIKKGRKKNSLNFRFLCHSAQRSTAFIYHPPYFIWYKEI